jgi:hypothetical protein
MEELSLFEFEVTDSDREPEDGFHGRGIRSLANQVTLKPVRKIKLNRHGFSGRRKPTCEAVIQPALALAQSR